MNNTNEMAAPIIPPATNPEKIDTKKLTQTIIAKTLAMLTKVASG